ncbi:hypothetical protein [Saccharothrix sp. NRRL B-16348]|nr:hypothetical protein [Saccharothrix sp. NRRL B-16348]
MPSHRTTAGAPAALTACNDNESMTDFPGSRTVVVQAGVGRATVAKAG